MIVGVDLSLTGTGMATLVDGTMTTTRITSSGRTKDTLAQRFDRQTIICDRILEIARGADLVVIETLFTGPKAGHVIDRAGAWWRITGSLLLWNIPVLCVAATMAKKFLTGSGSADKGSMVRAAGKMWPDWEPSSDKAIEDEADAIALASIGVALMGLRAEGLPGPPLPFEMTAYRAEVLTKLAPQVKDLGL